MADQPRPLEELIADPRFTALPDDQQQAAVVPNLDDRPRVDAGPLGNALDGEAVDTSSDEFGHRGVQDRLPLRLGQIPHSLI